MTSTQIAYHEDRIHKNAYSIQDYLDYYGITNVVTPDYYRCQYTVKYRYKGHWNTFHIPEIEVVRGNTLFYLNSILNACEVFPQ